MSRLLVKLHRPTRGLQSSPRTTIARRLALFEPSADCESALQSNARPAYKEGAAAILLECVERRRLSSLSAWLAYYNLAAAYSYLSIIDSYSRNTVGALFDALRSSRL